MTAILLGQHRSQLADIGPVPPIDGQPDSPKLPAPCHEGESPRRRLMSLRARKALIFICLLAFAVRAAYLLEAQANPMHLAPQMDAKYHLDWARSLLAGVDHHPGPFFRAPLYPWFLGACLWVTQGSLLAVLFIQALLGALTTWLTFELCRRALPRSGTLGPLIAASLTAVNWVLVYFDAELLLPTLAIPLQLHALIWTLKLREDPSPKRALFAGCSWGLAAIVRPNVLLFVLLLCLLEAFRRPRKLLVPLALGCGSLLPILPLTAYNASQGDAVLVSSQAGINLWIGNNPKSDGSTAVVPGTRPDWWGGHKDAIRQAEVAEGRPLSASEVSSHYTRRAVSWAADEPAAFLSHLLHKARLLVSHHELGNNADISFVSERFSWTMRALPPSFALLFGLGVAGLFFGLRRRELTPVVPGYLATYAFTVLAFFVCARFRAPLLPILACGAGHALSLMYGALMSGGLRAAAQLAVCSAALIGLSLLASPKASSAQAAGQWQLGVAAMQAGDNSEAIKLFEEALLSHPGYWYAWRDLGNARLGAGDLKGAEAALTQGLSLRPNDPWLADLLADVYFQSSRAAELNELGQQMLQADPTYATARYHLARAALLAEDPRAATEHTRSGLALDPSNFQCLFLDARLRSLAGDKLGACAAIALALDAARQGHDPAHASLASQESQRIGCP